jgi:flagellar hook-associated protein 1
MSSFVGLLTGLSGVRAAQTGLDITSHNVANANTLGYTRQRVELRASPSFHSPVGAMGTGVTVAAIARLRDAFLDDRARVAAGQEAAAGVRAEFLASLEFLSGEPDLGLSSRIGRLWTAAEAWANDPADVATRRQVLTELASITDGFQATALAWNQLASDTADRRDAVVTSANDTLRTLDQLNRVITNSEAGRVGPDLYDQRDLLLDRIAQLTGATTRIQSDGSATVTIGTTTLLSFADGPATLRLAGDGAAIEAVAAGGGVATVTAAVSGELGGLQQALVTELPDWSGQLDALARALADRINGINQTGRLADGTPGGPLLGYTPGTAAASLERIATGIDALAAAGAGTGAPGPYDGTNARRLADLRTEVVGGRTIESQLADLIVGLGGAVRSSEAAAKAAAGVGSGARLARAAEHGVSLDEEMVALVRYQRALEASARVMTTVDQALEVLVNRVGIVGR